MRIACCLALAALGISAAPATAEPRALVLVLPAQEPFNSLRWMDDAAFHVAAAAPAVDGESAGQTFLDISQGARVSARVYDDDLPRLRLGPDGRVHDWEAVVERADDAPSDLLPGLLGETIRAGGERIAYVGVRRGRHEGATIAADASGQVGTVMLGSRSGLNERIDRALRGHSLVVAEVPRGDGLVLFPRLDDLLVLVVAMSPEGETELLPTGVAFGDQRAHGLLTSRTTRRDGLVAITDFAPTVLDALRLDIPEEMQGRVMTATGGSWEEAQSLADRLDVVKGRRGPALTAAFAAWLVALAALALTGRTRLGLRLGLLAAIWMPGVALITGAIDPSGGVETAAIALAPLALAALTDRFARWPRGPALAATVVLTAHAADLVAGSPLIVRSLAGPNPGFGARFYGIGNELEAILAAIVLLGTGAAFSGVSKEGQTLFRNRVPVGFAVVCAIAAVFIGAGRLGADVGGVITLGAGGAAAVLASLPGGVTRRAVLIALLVPALAVVALAAIDLVTGGDAHLTRSVLAADSAGELVDVAERRFDISWDNLRQGTTPLSVGVFALALGYGVARRRALFRPLNGDRAFAAGMWGTLAATVVGALANDSGPTIFLIGAAALVLGAAYLTGKPLARGLT